MPKEFPLVSFTQTPRSPECWGYTPAELTSLTIGQTQNLVHPDNRLSFFSRYKDRLDGKPVHPFYEVRAIRKDGSIGWFELSGTQIEYNGEPAVLATYVDITERKQAEEMLRENGALLDKSQAIAHIFNIIKQITPFFVFSKLRAFVVGFPYLSLLCLCSLRATKTVNSFYSRKFPLQSLISLRHR